MRSLETSVDLLKLVTNNVDEVLFHLTFFLFYVV